ncbi:centrosome assembly protein spindle defective 2 isoform 2-T2 [Cochliomyia hominivorax]
MDQSGYKERSSNFRRDDNSLGILNMDNLKVFGDLSSDSIKNSSLRNASIESGRMINDRLNNERMKALEALKKSQKEDFFKRPLPVNSNKENSKSAINISSSNNPSMQLDHTDYVPFRRPNAINISDLVTDETINLESSSSCPPSASKDVKVSFEPTEITGRSTLYNKDIKNNKNMAMGGGGGINKGRDVYKAKHISVSDILASSFAPKARNLCETLQSGDTTLDSSERHVQSITSGCSSFTTYNGSRSLPRTADMSLSKNTCSEESFNGGFGTFSFSSAVGAGIAVDDSESFAPGELMQSKLISDEISWAQEYAAIPAATLSEQAKAKTSRQSAVVSNGFESPSTSNSMIAGDPNFSVGNFFNMRSDNIWNIVKSKSPDKCRTPIALVDDEDNTVTTTTISSDLEGSSTNLVTPKIDNKTYTRIEALSAQKQESKTQTPMQRQISMANIDHESKDSGNSTDNSYLLSMSAIDRALCNLDIPSDASGIGVSEQLLMQGKKSKSCMNPYLEPDNIETKMFSKGRSLGAGIKMNGNQERLNSVEEMILENKENLDPETKRSSGTGVGLSDTMSFTESVLNSSDMKQLQRSVNQPRSPLSPIEISSIPNIQVHSQTAADDGGEEADNDEWPGTPVTSNRRMRRTKSPRDKSPIKTNLSNMYDDSPDATTPVNSRPSRAYALNHKNKIEKETKSLSSTRLDGGDRNSNAECDFGISPNISNGHHSASSLVVRSNTLSVPQGGSPRCPSPARSPMSSPRNYHSSQMPSPTPSSLSGFQSPNLDATSNSDRQLLSVGTARKVVSSPVGSESSSTCSYGTMQTYRSAISATSGRSVSRCSSSSEFSHRDGKQIPLKVTNTELSWGSIKLRSDSRKSMQIKNIISKRLVIRVEVSGPGFQIVNSQRSNTITLHSQECRTISISFCPTVRGVAIGKLSFYAPSGATTIGNSFLDVALYGYGGNASIISQNISMGPVGSPFVTMGDVCELAQPLERTVSFYNKGPLLGFAAVTIDSMGLMMPRLSDAFEIHPRQILIPPKCMVDVQVVFRPKREEIKKIIKKMGNVLTLANMRVICGDEANRQRIRRLLSRMSEEERSKLSSSALDMLWTKFPQELEMTELCDMKENPNVAMDLASFFRIHEILLTINHDNMDDTVEASSLFLPDVDETVLFRTICAADSPTPTPPPCTLGTVDEIFEEDAESDHTTKSNNKQGTWSVSPRCLEMYVNKQVPTMLRIHNGFKSRQFFEVVCNPKLLLRFQPNDGYVAPDGGQTDIEVSLDERFQYPSGNVNVMVYMENERIMVPVKFIK